jgi:hypothetical protein
VVTVVRQLMASECNDLGAAARHYDANGSAIAFWKNPDDAR